MSGPHTDDDARLVARCREGEADAWASLVHRYQPLVYAVAVRAGFDAHGAADVFQIVFTQLLKSLATLSRPERLQAWVVTTAKRQALLARRMDQRTVSMSDGADADDEGPAADVADDAPLAEDVLSDLQQSDLLRRAFGQLGDRCRSLLQLLYADEDERLPYEQVAHRLGMPVGSIGPMRARCLSKLRGFFENLDR